MEDDTAQRGKTRRSRLWPRAARQRSRRRSLEEAIKLIEEDGLTQAEKKQAAKLRRLLNDLDLPEAD
jgi:hypothetical protein